MSSTGKFLPIQLIYTGERHAVYLNMTSQSHFLLDLLRIIGQTQINLSSFDEIIFPCLQQIKEERGLPQEQLSLVIMDTFKGQDNSILKKFCSKSRCEIVIVPHNLTNNFQPLDLSSEGFYSKPIQ